MAERLSAAERTHPSRVSGRLEFGNQPSRVSVDIVQREGFHLVVMGSDGEGRGHVVAVVAKATACKVVTRPETAAA